jgi:hypothetical protein
VTRTEHILGIAGILAALAGFPAAAAAEPVKNEPSPHSRIHIEMRADLVDARIGDASLGDVAVALSARTGLKYRLPRGLASSHRLSVDIRGLPLREALRQMLRGLSYMVYPTAGGLRLIVLSAGSADSEPSSLESSGMPVNSRGAKERGSEGRLRKAIRALAAADRVTRQEAMRSLAGLDDPRATQALIEVAVTRSDRAEPESRINAVELLLERVRGENFSDAAVLETLSQLAEDSDPFIANLSRQAIQEAGAVRPADAEEPQSADFLPGSADMSPVNTPELPQAGGSAFPSVVPDTSWAGTGQLR